MFKKNGSIIAIVVILLVLGGAIFGINYVNATSYVATVAGEKITNPEYNYFLALVKGEMEQEGVSDQTIDSIPNSDVWVEQAKKEALDRAKEFKIQVIKAKEKGITLEAKDYKDIQSVKENLISQIMSNLSAAGTTKNVREQAEKDFKKVYNISLKQYGKIVEDLKLVYKFSEGEQKKLTATDDEIKDHYNKNKNDFDIVTIRQALLATVDIQTGQPLAEDKIKEAEKKANETLEKAKAGEDMIALVKAVSNDPAVSENEGKLEVNYISDWPKEFKDWVFGNKKGDIGLVKSDYAYHVIKIEDRTSFDSAKEKVKSAVLANKYEEIVDKWAKEPQYDVVKNGNVMESIKIN